MQRLTKAAVATGGAAVLLLGGVATVAYWTDTGTATGLNLASGSLTVNDGTCEPWVYTDDDSGTGTVDDLVPGDEVETVCTLEVQGEGTHLGITASLETTPGLTGDAALVSALNVDVGAVEVDGTPVTPSGVNISGVGTHDVSVAVVVEFPYGDATTVSLNDTQNLAALLDDVTINVVQTHTP